MIWSQQELSESDLMGPHEGNYIVTSSTEMVWRVAKQKSVFRFVNFHINSYINNSMYTQFGVYLKKSIYIYMYMHDYMYI